MAKVDRMVSMGHLQNKQPPSFLIRTYKHSWPFFVVILVERIDQSGFLTISVSAYTVDVVPIPERFGLVESMTDCGPTLHCPDIL